MGKRLLVSEHTQVTTRQGELVKMAPAGADFVDWCRSALAGDWRAEAAVAYERYRAEMPMKLIMERVLDKTLQSSSSPSDAAGRRITPRGLTFELPMLVESVDGFNIVLFEEMFFVLSQALGQIKLTEIADYDDFKSQNEGFMIAASLQEARTMIRHCVTTA